MAEEKVTPAAEPVATPEAASASVPEIPADPFAEAMVGDLGKETFGEDMTPPVESGEEKEASDTETDTGDESKDERPDTETATDSTLAEMMAELELTGKYKTPADVLKAHVHLNKELEDQKYEGRQLKELLNKVVSEKLAEPKAEPKAEELTDEEREQMAWFEKMAEKAGYVRKDEIEPLKKGLESAEGRVLVENGARSIEVLDGLSDVATHFRKTGSFPDSGVNERWDAMMVEYQKRPSMRGMTLDEAVDVLYTLTTPKSTKPTVPAVSTDKKKSANTASSTRGSERATVPPDFMTWSSDKMLQWMQTQGLAD